MLLIGGGQLAPLLLPMMMRLPVSAAIELSDSQLIGVRPRIHPRTIHVANDPAIVLQNMKSPQPLPDWAPIALGRTGLKVSPIGMGCYRVLEDSPVHRRALNAALDAGINLIDTSTNYTDGSSERLVGSVLAERDRSKIVVVTKVGYIQGRNLAIAQEREAEGKPFSEITWVQPRLWHCISPDWLEDQITRSLERLKISKIDVLLLHNPEYFLKVNPDHAEYYRRIERAFGHLEEEVRRGRISWYGVSSNTFPDPKDGEEFTSLETVLEIAEKVGGADHKMGVIQFPLNLYEPGAALEDNNSGNSVLELAAARSIGTLINRPLNAFAGNHMVRLADYPSHSNAPPEPRFRSALGRAIEHETGFPAEAAKSLGVASTQACWGHVLQANLNAIRELETWRQLRDYQIEPTMDQALARLLTHPASKPWAERQSDLLADLFKTVTELLESQAAAISTRISEELTRAVPRLAETPTLSRKALRVYRSLPGVCSVLLGMRRPEYVEDACGQATQDQDALLTPEQAFDAFDAAPWDVTRS